MLSLILHRIRLLIILICLFPSNVYATTTSAGMNVSGEGSNYIFLYRGNDTALYDLMKDTYGSGLGWTAVCNGGGCVTGSYYVIGAVSHPSTGYMFMYTFDSDGNVAYPESGEYYYFTDETYPPVPTPVYSAAPTTAQQQRMDTALATVNAGNVGDTFEGTVTGDSNNIYIEQAGGISYINLLVLGNSNDINLKQDMTTGAHGYNETTIIGSSNDIDVLQEGSGNKAAFVTIGGSSNNAEVIQKGSGEHYAYLTINGSGHDASIIQEGSGNHDAVVTLDGSQPWNFDLNQSGSTDKTYSLPHTLTDGSSVNGTCSAIGGCNLTVNQN